MCIENVYYKVEGKVSDFVECWGAELDYNKHQGHVPMLLETTR